MKQIKNNAYSIAHKPKSETIFDHISPVLQGDTISSEMLTALVDTGASLQIFDNIPDSRRQGSVQYQMEHILPMIIQAIVSEGSCSPDSIADHIWANRIKYLRQGHLESQDRCPSKETIQTVLSIIEPDVLAQQLIHSIEKMFGEISSEVQHNIIGIIQFDGKEMRGTGRSEDSMNPSRNTNMVNMYDAYTGVCLNSVPADSKSNEIPTVQKLLRSVNVRRQFISFDALHAQTETLEYINNQKGWYCVAVKKNQRKTFVSLETLFENPKNTRSIKHVEGHDRDFSYIPLSGKRKLEKFPSARYAVKMISHVRPGDNPREMIFISNSANIEKVLYVIENRWDIENGLHKVKDSVLIGEDKLRAQNVNLQRNLAIINNFIVVVTRIIQSTHEKMTLARAKKTVRAYPEECLKLVCGMLKDKDLLKLIKIGVKKETQKHLANGEIGLAFDSCCENNQRKQLL